MLWRMNPRMPGFKMDVDVYYKFTFSEEELMDLTNELANITLVDAEVTEGCPTLQKIYTYCLNMLDVKYKEVAPYED